MWNKLGTRVSVCTLRSCLGEIYDWLYAWRARRKGRKGQALPDWQVAGLTNRETCIGDLSWVATSRVDLYTHPPGS